MLRNGDGGAEELNSRGRKEERKMVFSNKNSGLEPYTSNDYRLQGLAAAFYCDTKPAIHLSQATAFLAMASRLQNQPLAGISLSTLLSPTCQGQHFT